MDNSENVHTYESTNIWNSTSPITYTYKGNTFTNYLGNYWDDYEEKYPDAEEKDGTGIWNESYCIDGDKDNYPLKERFENYQIGPAPKTIYVDDDFVDEPPNHKWDTIQEGVIDANPGDTIIVRDGTYTENVKFNEPYLAIKSENGADATVVQAANPDDNVFEVTADYVNIRGFTVQETIHYSKAGIYLDNVNFCNISNNTVSNNRIGIWIKTSSNNKIINNNVSSNEAWGNGIGIRLYDSSYNEIANNIANSNDWQGIYLVSSTNNKLTNNSASKNRETGISLGESSNNNIITNNNVTFNGWAGPMGGINVWKSNNNKIYLNNFINNTINVMSYESTNIWNSPEKITYKYKGNTFTNYTGNYWDDYNGSDANNDGTGDTPYSIDSDKDNYPLIKLSENYFLQEKQPPIADFTYSVEGLKVNFTDQSYDPDGSIIKWNWNFGDGTTSNKQNPTHSYQLGGTYSATLTVTDNDGYKSSITKNIQVGNIIIKVIYPKEIALGIALKVQVETSVEKDIALSIGGFSETKRGKEVLFSVDTSDFEPGSYTLTVVAGAYEDTYSGAVLIYDPSVYQAIASGIDRLEKTSEKEMHEICGKPGEAITYHVYKIVEQIQVDKDVTVGDVLNKIRSTIDDVGGKQSSELEKFKDIILGINSSLSGEVKELEQAVKMIDNLQAAIDEAKYLTSEEGIVESVNKYVTEPALYTVVAADEMALIEERSKSAKGDINKRYTKEELNHAKEILTVGNEAIANTDGEIIYKLDIGKVLGHEISAKPDLDYFVAMNKESLDPSYYGGHYNPLWVYHMTKANIQSILTAPAWVGWIEATPESNANEIRPCVAFIPIKIVIEAAKTYIKYVKMLKKVSPWVIEGGTVISADLLAKEVDEEHTDVIQSLSTIEGSELNPVAPPMIKNNGLYASKGDILVTTSPDGRIVGFDYVKADTEFLAPAGYKVTSLNSQQSMSHYFKADENEPEINMSLHTDKSSYSLGEKVYLTVNVTSVENIEDAMLWLFVPEENITLKEFLNISKESSLSYTYNFTVQNETWHVPRAFLSIFGKILAKSHTSFAVGVGSYERGLIYLDYNEFYEPGTVSINVSVYNTGNVPLDSELLYWGEDRSFNGTVGMPTLQPCESKVQALVLDITDPKVYEIYFVLKSKSSSTDLEYNIARFTVKAIDTLLAFPTTDKPIYNLSENVNINVVIKNVRLKNVSFPHSLKIKEPSGRVIVNSSSFKADQMGTYEVEAIPIADGYHIVEGETLFIVENQSDLVVEALCEVNTTKILVETALGGRVEGARVVVNGHTLTTDEGGVARIGKLSQTLLIKAEKFGYNPFIGSIESNWAPIALFNFTPKDPVVDQDITFNASSSYDPDGYITNYEWDFGDGTNGTGEIVTHSYSNFGIYTVNLTVIDNDGVINTETKNVTVSGGKIIYVDDDFIDDPPNHKWDTIQEGINDTEDGDTVLVYDGTYEENVKVDKRLTIRSENGADATIVQVADPNDHVFEVTADYVNISGFTVKGATGTRKAGIHLNADHCNISYNVASNNYNGIRLYESNNNTIVNNSVYENRWGITAHESNFNRIENNTVHENRGQKGDGINLYRSEGNIVKRNVVFNNTDAGIQVMNNSCNNLIEENDIRLNEWSGISLWHANENTIVNNSACYNVINIWLKDSNRCLIKGNNASYALKKCGIGLENSRHNRVEENVANGNAKVGILLKYSSIANEVKDNKANLNSKGIFIGFSSDNNTLSNNTASNNEHGIHLWRSSDNVIYLNNFINNTENVYSYESTNIWNFTSPITYTYKGKPYMNYLGNYWDDYKEKYPDAEEIDGTGIWNESYSVDGDKDYYPLMEPWENYFGVYEPGLNITITTDKTEYSPGDYVHLTQQFTNENEESVIITNPITVTFIAPDGSVVLQEDLGISVYITLRKGGKYSIGYSFKLPDDAKEGYYDVRVSISGGNYVKTVEGLFFVEAGSLT